MAQEKESMIGEFLKFFPGVKPKEKNEKIVVQEKLDIQEEHRIIKLVEMAILNDNPVQVQIPGEKGAFYTHFSTDDPDDMTLFAKGQALAIKPLDPPLGNIKIRFSPGVRLNFFTDLYIVETNVQFMRIREDRTIQLTFPKRLEQGPQKRSSERVKIDNKTKFVLDIVRPSGLSFNAQTIDVSMGGICFVADENYAKLSEGMKVTINMSSPLCSMVSVTGLLLGFFKREKDSCYRVKFIIKSRGVQQQLQTLLLALTRERAEKRERLFKS